MIQGHLFVSFASINGAISLHCELLHFGVSEALEIKEILNTIIIWDVTPCSLLDVHRRYKESNCLLLQIRRVNLSVTMTKRAGLWSLVVFLAYLSTLHFEIVCSSELTNYIELSPS
jgi:hypothetical protein